jgi:carbon dioxide concentrating mechanism protein CcmO
MRMEVQNNHPSSLTRPVSAGGRSPQDFSNMALGLVSTRSFPAIIVTADMMLKSSGVTLVGYEKTGGGHCTAVVRGGISDIRIAVEVGAETAEKFGQFVSKSIISRPLPNLDAVLPIGRRLSRAVTEPGFNRLRNQAVGLLETRGFPAMVGACDAMMKSAEVHLAAYEVIGDGLCTAIIRGRVADVAVALEAGMSEAERIGELHAIGLIPRPLEDMENTLPVASCWIERPEPLAMPLDLKETEKELVELPNLSELPTALEEAMPLQLPPVDSVNADLEPPLEARPLPKVELPTDEMD